MTYVVGTTRLTQLLISRLTRLNIECLCQSFARSTHWHAVVVSRASGLESSPRNASKANALSDRMTRPALLIRAFAISFSLSSLEQQREQLTAIQKLVIDQFAEILIAKQREQLEHPA